MLKPSFFAQLPDEFKDFLTEHLGDKSPSEVLCIHSHHELFYKKWKLLVDEEFMLRSAWVRTNVNLVGSRVLSVTILQMDVEGIST